MWKTFGLLLSKVCPNWSLSMDGQEWVIRVSTSPPEVDRQVGLGVLGLANFLAYHGVSYAAFGEALEAVNADWTLTKLLHLFWPESGWQPLLVQHRLPGQRGWKELSQSLRQHPAPTTTKISPATQQLLRSLLPSLAT